MQAELHKALEPLALVDPGLAAAVAERLSRKSTPVSPELLDQLAAESLRALAIEVSFGRAVALEQLVAPREREQKGDAEASDNDWSRCNLD